MKKLAFLIVVFLAFNAQAKSVEVYFTPSPQCESKLVALIEKSSDTIEAAVYSVNNDRVVAALKQAHDRGVKVKILTDRLQASGRNSKVSDLYEYGLDVRVHSKHKIEHNKFAVFDGMTAMTGSYNWTNPASSKNSENCVFFVGDTEVSAKFEDRFDYLWQLNKKSKSDLWFAKRYAAGKI